MKKVFSAFCALILAGAGCAPDAAPSPTPAPIEQPAPSPTPAPSPEPEPAAMETLRIGMNAGNFFFSPKVVTAKAGQDVEITIGSVEGTHAFVIDGVVNTMIRAGSKVKFKAPAAAGSYTFYCNIANHHQLGMEGTLIVQ